MTTLFSRIALVAAMAAATFFLGGIEIDKAPCDNPNSYECCYYQCTHDPGSGCNRSGSCCRQLCL